MKKFIYQSTFVTIFKVLSGLSTFFLYILFSRYLGPEILGRYELALTLIMLVSTLLSLGLVQYVCVNLSRVGVSEIGGLITRVNSFYLLYSTIMLAIVGVVVYFDFIKINLNKYEWTFIFGAAFLFYYRNLFLGILHLTFFPVRYSLVEASYPVFVFVFMMVYLFGARDYSLSSMLFVNFLSLLIVALCYAFERPLNSYLFKKKDYYDFKKIIEESSPWFFISVLSWLMYSVDKWILQLFWGAYKVGIYSQIFKLSSCYNLMLVSLVSIMLTPYIYLSLRKDEAITTWNKIKKQVMGLAVITFVVLLLDYAIGERVYRLMVGEKYLEGFKYNYLIITNFMLTAIIGYFSYIFIFFNSTKHIQVPLLIGFFLNTTIGIYSTPIIGIYGVIISTTISQIIMLVYVIIKAKKMLFSQATS